MHEQPRDALTSELVQRRGEALVRFAYLLPSVLYRWDGTSLTPVGEGYETVAG